MNLNYIKQSQTQLGKFREGPLALGNSTTCKNGVSSALGEVGLDIYILRPWAASI